MDWHVFFENINLNYYDYDAYQLLMTVISYTDEIGMECQCSSCFGTLFLWKMDSMYHWGDCFGYSFLHYR